MTTPEAPQIQLLPGMIVMGYHDCGTNTLQAGQMLLVERIRFEPADGYPPDRFGSWIVALVGEEDEPLNDRSWIIDEYAPVEVLFAPPDDFNPDDYHTGIGPSVWTFRQGGEADDAE